MLALPLMYRWRRVIATACVMTTLCAVTGVAGVGTQAASADSFPVLNPCVLPANPANSDALPSQLTEIETGSCVPQWSADYYKLVPDGTSNVDFANGRFVTGATATASPATVSVGTGIPTSTSLTFDSSYVYRANGSASGPLDLFIPATAFVSGESWPSPGTFSEERQRDPTTGVWSDWGKVFDPANAPFTLSIPTSCGLLPNPPFQDIIAPPPVTCPATVTWNSNLDHTDWQVMFPVSWDALNTHDQAQHVGGTGTTWFAINVNGNNPGNHAPVAAFHDTALATAGQYHFVSDSTDADSDPLTYDWNFHDSTADATGDNTVHTFAKPGTYNVSLTVTDTHGASDTISHSVVVAAPTLSAVVTLPDKTNTTFAPDEQTTARVTVHAGSGVGSLTGLKLGGTGLNIDRPDRLSIVTSPADVGTAFDLAPGTSKTFDFTVKATSVPGNAVLSAHVTGNDAASHSVTADSANLTVRVVVPILKVTVTANPNDFTLKETDKGITPQTVTVTITTLNTSADPVTNITIPGKLTLSSSDTPAPDPFAVAQQPPIKDHTIDSLAAGDHVTDTYKLTVTGNGHYKAATLVTFANPDNTGTLTQDGSAAIVAAPASILFFKAAVQGDLPKLIPTGDDVTIAGTVENRSTTQTITLDPITAKTAGNAGGGAMRALGTTVPCDCALPLIGTLKPGQKIAWDTKITTQQGSGTRGTVSFAPTGDIISEDGTTTAIPADKIHVSDGSDVITLALDDHDPTGGKLDSSNVLTWAGEFSYGAISSAVNFIADLPQFIDAVTEAAVKYPSMLLGEGLKYLATQGPNAWRVALNGLEGLAEIGRGFAADPSAEAAWVKQTVSSFSSDMLDRWNVTEAQAEAAVNNFTTKVFTPFWTMWEKGNYNGAFETLGGVFGAVVGPEKFAQAADRVALCLLKSTALLGKVQEAMTLSSELPNNLRNLAKSAPAAMKDLWLGKTVSLTEGQAAFGVPETTLQLLLGYAEEKGLLVSIRYRSPGALEWLKAPRFAVLKPEAIKVKNVDSIDTAFLGYLPADQDTVIWKKPITDAQLDANLKAANANAAEASAARARLALRQSEWNGKVGKDMTQFQKQGWVDVGFNYSDNAIPTTVREYQPDVRDMQFQQVYDSNGRPLNDYFRVMMDDKGGVSRRITGDVDLVDVRHSDGTALTAEERANFYDETQGILNLQHPETFTWLKTNEDGGTDFLWEKKAELLGAHTPEGGEFVLQIGPDGKMRSVLADPNLTWFDPNSKESFVWWLGGYRTTASDVLTVGGVAFPSYVSDQLNGFIPPDQWPLLPNTGSATTQSLSTPTPGVSQVQLMADTVVTGNPAAEPAAASAVTTAATAPKNQLGNCTWQFSRAANAQALQPDQQRGLQAFTASGWQETNWHAVCNGAGGNILVRPETAVASDTSAGATELPISSLQLVDPEATSTTPWFQTGDRVVINPGGATQEYAVVDGFGSLKFAAGMQYAHTTGEVVALVGSTTAPLAFTGSDNRTLVWLGLYLCGIGLLFMRSKRLHKLMRTAFPAALPVRSTTVAHQSARPITQLLTNIRRRAD